MPSIDDGNKRKIIRDPIHGYIEIGEKLVKDVIDTPIFQRLLRIQQTNLSVLYPSATHTRFEHSLGVFFLGRILFDAISKNTNFEDFGISKRDFEEKYKNTFLLACLLHDVGHAPLSHAGEMFFNKKKLYKELSSLSIDLKNSTEKGIPSKSPAKHELMSCIVALSAFNDVISKYEVDKDLFCRIITGIEYMGAVEEKGIKNILIRILNSSFDVDKMDYIMRDSVSAGITVLTLDVYRIANSLAILSDNGTPRIAFKKVGFSVINSVINNRNYLYYWLYGHHKVQYHYNVLQRYITELKNNFSEQIERLFSSEAIIGEMKIDLPLLKTVRQVDDYDLYNIMKNAPDLNPIFKIYYEQIFERKHYSPLWKTKIDFDAECKKSISLQENLGTILTMADNPTHKIESNVSKLLQNVDLKLGEFYIFNREFKVNFPDFEEKIYFYVHGSMPPFKRYSDLFNYEGTIPKSEISSKMFYVFLKKDKIETGIKILKILEGLDKH